MTTGLQYDEAAAKRLQAIYLTPDVVAQRREVLRALALRPGERVLDIGSGPGFLARDIAAAVGPAGRVSGVDISESLVVMSRAVCADQSWVTFEVGDATKLPFADGEFDVAVSTQVYEYVGDVPMALAELYRVLRPGGRALILDTDWDSIVWYTPDRALTDRVLAAWSEHCADPHLPRTLAAKLKRAGFALGRREVVPLFNPEWDPDTYSYKMVDLIAAFVAGRRGITPAEAEAWAATVQNPAGAADYFFSLNRYLFLATRPGGHLA